MNLVRVGESGAERPAVLDEKGIARDLSGLVGDFGPGFFAGGGLALVAEAVARGGLPAVTGRLGAPIARPGKVVCIGLNYSDHAAETGQEPPPRPVMFMKDPATVVGPHDDVLIPRGSAKTDWEVELGVVIGATARYLDSPADGLAAVAGYAISHDVSERAFQLELSPQWDIGESCETFNPLGPWLVTADEVPAPQALGLPDHPYLRGGDRVHLEIDGLGQAEQRFVAANSRGTTEKTEKAEGRQGIP